MAGRDELRRLVREELAKQRVFEIATVAAVRDDGTVNLRWGEQVLDAVPANVSYSPRKAGDTVLVARWSGGFRVIDKVGSPAAVTQTPETTVTWGNAAPNGSGWQQASTVWVRDHQVYAQLAAGPPPPADHPAPVTISPSSQGAWRDGYIDSGQDPTQGAYPSYPHPYTGAWFYGSQVSAAGAGLASVSIRLSRSGSRHGTFGGVTPRLYLLASSAAGSKTPVLGSGPVSGPALGLGETDSFTLPTSWRDALAAGTAHGIGVSAGVGSDYLIFTGSCGQLTLTYN